MGDRVSLLGLYKSPPSLFYTSTKVSPLIVGTNTTAKALLCHANRPDVNHNLEETN
jgi:hypothetical protein